MLGKLIRYEFRSSWKMIALMNVFVVVAGIFGCIEFAHMDYEEPTALQAFTLVGILLFYILTTFAASIGCVVYIAVRYYKNLYTNEGYLMHTLPVTPRQLILSKLIVHSLYNIITAVLIGISVFAVIYTAVNSITQETASVYRELRYEFAQMEADLGMSMTTYLLLMAGFSIIGIVQSILHIYVSAAIGQLSSKYKVLASIGVYIAIYTVVNIVAMVGSLAVVGFREFSTVSRKAVVIGVTSDSSYALTPSILGLVISVATGILFYAVTERLMRKRLNLD